MISSKFSLPAAILAAVLVLPSGPAGATTHHHHHAKAATHRHGAVSRHRHSHARVAQAGTRHHGRKLAEATDRKGRLEKTANVTPHRHAALCETVMEHRHWVTHCRGGKSQTG